MKTRTTHSPFSPTFGPCAHLTQQKHPDPEPVRDAQARAGELKGKGYMVVKSAIKDGNQNQVAKIETRAERKDSQQQFIWEIERQLKADNYEAMGFIDIDLDGTVVDFVVTTDDEAVLFAVLPPEHDCDVDESVGDEIGDEEERTLDCIGEDNTISPRLLGLLSRYEKAIRHFTKDNGTAFRLAILAGRNTLLALERAWGEKLRDAGIELVSHESAMDYLRSVFPVPREEDGNDPATDGD